MRASTSSASASARSLLCHCMPRQNPAASRPLALARQIHTRPNLPYDVSNGCPPFLSRDALQGTASTWHQGCLDRLNDLTRGTQYENKSVAKTVVDASKRREDTLIFNYASEALNNGFFLSCLTPDPSPSATASLPGGQIQKAIEQSFGSPTSFINRFSSFANGMFGSGYVWLVMDAVDNLAVVGTYGAGTVLVNGEKPSAIEHDLFVSAREEAEQEPEAAGPTAEAMDAARQTQRDQENRAPVHEYENPASASPSSFGQARSYSTSSSFLPSQRRTAKSNITAEYLSDPLELRGLGDNEFASSSSKREDAKRFQSIHPLLCLSLQPHVYIGDYGIWGKEAYITNFWKNVDWERMEERYTKVKAIYGKGGQTGHAAEGPRFSLQDGNAFGDMRHQGR